MCALPAVVTGGVARTAANIDKAWIGTDVYELLATELGDRPLSVLNDADAAGMAEDHYGAGKDYKGVVMLLTFGTGIGSAIMYNGVLIPNTELGHMHVGEKEAEHQASSKVKEDKDLSYPQWAEEVSKVLSAYEALFWPEVFIAGGGISRKAHKWIPLLTNRTPVVPATLQNYGRELSAPRWQWWRGCDPECRYNGTQAGFEPVPPSPSFAEFHSA